MAGGGANDTNLEGRLSLDLDARAEGNLSAHLLQSPHSSGWEKSGRC